MADTDRVRMKAKSTFNNPQIESHAADKDGPLARAAHGTVIEDDEFTTNELHAAELERGGLAERIAGDASPETERAARVRGFQTSASGKPAAIVEKPLTGTAKA